MPGRFPVRLTWFCLLLLAAACGNPVEGAEPAAGPANTAVQQQTLGETVVPPFEVKGELEGLLLVWFDDKGVHTARTRSDIPEGHREHVRVESLRVAPQDSDDVFVADLRAPSGDRSYPVRRATRDAFDGLVDKAKPPAPAQDSSVVVYKASWCGACKAAEAFLRQKQVSFVEKDVEKDPGAQAEMQQKAQAKGLRPRGVPVIDFRGEILLGFDQARLEELIARTPQPI